MFVHRALFSLSLFLALSHAGLAQETAPETTPSQEEFIELACDVCLPTSIPGNALQGSFRGGWQVGVDHQFTSFKSLYQDNNQISNTNGEKLSSNTTTLNLTYNVTPKAGFLISVPMINRSYRRTGDSGVESGSVSGLGDMVVRARYAPVARFSEKSSLIWTIDAGLKLPTGDSSMLRDSGHSHSTAAATEEHHEEEHEAEEAHINAHNGVDHDAEESEPEEHAVALATTEHAHAHTSAIENHDLSLGSGSVDGVIGSGLVFRRGNFLATAGGQYLLRTTGTGGYRYGDLFTWRLAPGYLFVNNENRVMGLQFNASGEHQDPNSVLGTRDHGYIDSVFLGPEFLMQSKNLSLNLGLDLPVKYHSEGLTVAPDYRARMNFNWRF